MSREFAASSHPLREANEELAWLQVTADAKLEASYREMSLDVDREREASEWVEG